MKYKILIIASLSIFFFACKRDKNFQGPDLNDLYGPFAFMEPLKKNLDSVDFAAGQTVYFTARFTKQVDWQITITGLSSGAEKIISGRSKTLDMANSGWNGSTTLFPIFRSENCTILLTFPSEKDTIRDSIKVIKPKINSGYLVTDFESGQNFKWNIFHQMGDKMEYHIDDTLLVPQGNHYFSMAGIVNWDYAIAYVEIPSVANGLNHFPLSSNPDNVYLNILVWGEPGIANAFLQIAYREDDDGNNAFNNISDDEMIYEIKNINWEGWKLVSIRYSDLAITSTKGNGQHNPDRLVNMRFFLLADPATGYSKTKLDYIFFTENKPLEP